MADLADLYGAHVETLIDRTSKALERTGFERLVVHAGDLMAKSRFDDLEHPFGPTPAFAHWVPWAWPGSALEFRKGRSATLYALRRDDFWERFEAPHKDLVASAIDVEEVSDLTAIKEMSGKAGSVFVGESMTTALKLGFDEAVVNPPALLEELHELRVHKTPYEVETLSAANHQAVRGHKVVEQAFYGGERSELALHLAYLGAIQQDDSQTPYKNIVALGSAAAVMHHHAYQPRPGAKSLLIDAGAQVRGYNSDITRTYVDESRPSIFGDLLDAMESLQQAICHRIEVGKSYEQLHDEAHILIGELLVEQNFVSCSAEAAVAEGLTRIFFPHGLGHSLGVQVHDVGCRKNPPRKDNAWLRNTRTIESGQVFTIEPGFYFIDALLDSVRKDSADSVVWERVDAVREYGGIRIEDNIVVLEDSSIPPIRNLTREAFAAA